MTGTLRVLLASCTAVALGSALAVIFVAPDAEPEPQATAVRAERGPTRRTGASEAEVVFAPPAAPAPESVVAAQPPTRAVAVAETPALTGSAVDAPSARARARAVAALAALAAEEDPVAATILGEELALHVDALDASGRAALVALARHGAAAPRSEALRALGRLEPTPDTVALVVAAFVTFPSARTREAAADALLLLRDRGAPSDVTRAALLDVTSPGFGPLDEALTRVRSSASK